jgi:YfiH family protein
VKINAQWIVPDWPAPANVRALITTRAGGVSNGPWGAPGHDGGMNLGFGSGDAAQDVRANRARLRALLPSEPRWLKQVHGAKIVEAEGAADPPEADASTAIAPDVVCAVLVADCLPVLLAERQGRAVAAAHAGWRGIAAGVVQDCVHALRRRLDDPAAELIAYLGPAIGPEAFEVGGEVLEAMCTRLPKAGDTFRAIGGGKYLADLFALTRQALAQVDVLAIYGGTESTYADPSRFYSYRRDGVTGRHAALIWQVAPD